MGNIKYEEKSVVELKEIAKERGIKGVSALRKQELIDLLSAVDAKLEQVKLDSELKKKQQDDTKKSSSKTSDVKEVKAKKEVKADKEVKTVKVVKAENEVRDVKTVKENKKEVYNTNIQDSANVQNTTNAQVQYNNYQNINHSNNTQSVNQNVNHQNGQYANQNINHANKYNNQNINQNHVNHNNNNNQNNNIVNINNEQGEPKEGILEVLPDGYGFIRCDNYLPGDNDVYVSPAQIRKFGLKTGDIINGFTKLKNSNEKFGALLYVKTINDVPLAAIQNRPKFEELTPIFPNRRIRLERKDGEKGSHSMRMVDLVSPIGCGQRGMIVAPPKTGKTTLLKQIAKSITTNYPNMKLIILLIDERPEEVTDIKESIKGGNVEVIHSTFDELPENHKRVSEMVIERAKRLVEQKRDVVILLDSITRLARAYNLTVTASGRTLSGGLDPAALHMPKKFFGAARNMREGGSLTILATALVETGSRMDDVVFEEFKGTGNMELVLDRSLSEKRIFPALDLSKSSTRRDDLLLDKREAEAAIIMRRALSGMKSDEALERIVDLFIKTKNNNDFIEIIKKTKLV